jgi:hypothetical protein
MSDTGNRSPQDAWVSRVPGVDRKTNRSAATPAPPPSRVRAAEHRRHARESVLATLKDLETSIRSMNDPLGTDAIILVKAISHNLTVAPRTSQQIGELKRYLQTDPIIDDGESPNGFGIDVQIRAPLMAALLTLEQSMAA